MKAKSLVSYNGSSNSWCIFPTLHLYLLVDYTHITQISEGRLKSSSTTQTGIRRTFVFKQSSKNTMYIINWQLCAFPLAWKTCYILPLVSFFSQNYSLEKKYSWMSFCQHSSSAGSRTFVRLLWWQIWKDILFNSTTVKSNCLICHTAGPLTPLCL